MKYKTTFRIEGERMEVDGLNMRSEPEEKLPCSYQADNEFFLEK